MTTRALTARNPWALIFSLACALLIVSLFRYPPQTLSPLSSDTESTRSHYSSLFCPRSTTKETKLIYLKLHKVGSSTVTNVIHRFGLRNNLKFLNPKPLPHVKPVNLKKSHFSPSAKADIICNHGIYDKQWMTGVVPNGKIFTLVRDPVSRFVSHYNYYFRERKGTKWEEFLYSKEAKEAANRMSHDLGARTEGELNKLLEDIDENFVLVGLLEEFNVFMLLLGDILSWDLADVVYLPQKVSPEAQSLRTEITEDEKAYILKLSSLDARLYRHCKRVFEEKKAGYRQKLKGGEVEEAKGAAQRLLQADLEVYERELSEVRQKCSEAEHNPKQFGIIGTSLGQYYRCDELSWVNTEYAHMLNYVQDSSGMYS